MVLGFHRDGLPDLYQDAWMITAAFSRHTAPLQALTLDIRDLLIATRPVLNDLRNAFGQAEIKHITPDGALRLRAFNDPQLAELAASWNVETTLEQLPS